MNIHKTLRQAFYEYFRPSANADQCWEWAGQRLNTGYGRVSFSGKRFLAHRVSYELHNGSIPKGLHICHTCDNKLCVNPRHLFMGTHQENIADAKAKGIMAFGERAGPAKITADDVLEIRRLYAEGVLQANLADRFGVLQPQISRIVNGKTWQWLIGESK